jgi:hypothetical protein
MSAADEISPTFSKRMHNITGIARSLYQRPSIRLVRSLCND